MNACIIILECGFPSRNTQVEVFGKRRSSVGRMGMVSGLADPAKDVESHESDVDTTHLQWGNPSSDMRSQYPGEKSS